MCEHRGEGAGAERASVAAATCEALESGARVPTRAPRTHPSSHLEMMADMRGLHWFIHRRGVTPLVLFWKRSGNMAKKSGNTAVLTSSVWMAATPLVACEPTMARCAMRTHLGWPAGGGGEGRGGGGRGGESDWRH